MFTFVPYTLAKHIDVLTFSHLNDRSFCWKQLTPWNNLFRLLAFLRSLLCCPPDWHLLAYWKHHGRDNILTSLSRGEDVWKLFGDWRYNFEYRIQISGVRPSFCFYLKKLRDECLERQAESSTVAVCDTCCRWTARTSNASAANFIAAKVVISKPKGGERLPRVLLPFCNVWLSFRTFQQYGRRSQNGDWMSTAADCAPHGCLVVTYLEP